MKNMFLPKKQTGRPLMDVYIEENVLKCLLDTGSSHNFISLNKVDENGYVYQKETQPVQLGVGVSNTVGKLNIDVQISGEVHCLEFYVINNLDEEMIIGFTDVKRLNLLDLYSDFSFTVEKYCNNSEKNFISDDPNIVKIVEEHLCDIDRVGLLKIDDHHEIRLIDEKLMISSRPYRRDPESRKIIRDKVNDLVESGKVVQSDSHITSPLSSLKKRMDHIDCASTIEN